MQSQIRSEEPLIMSKHLCVVSRWFEYKARSAGDSHSYRPSSQRGNRAIWAQPFGPWHILPSTALRLAQVTSATSRSVRLVLSEI